MTERELSRIVVEAVAEDKGVPPLEVEPSLYTVCDPDALNKLFSPSPTGHPRSEGFVVLYLDDRRVTVYADGTVSVDVAY